MTTKDLLKHNINQAHFIANAYLKDLSDSDLLTRPAPGANHIAWQLGHLIASERQMIEAIGCRMPELPAGFVEKHSKETAASNGPAGFATKSEYLALFARMHEATLRAIDATADADMDRPGPESMRAYAPTVGAIFAMIATHEVMHAGQFAVLRRKLGKPVVI
ncbi:DinB superfamily protein [Phycisphaerae bacterium RAS1]|nr:DinB superfamily protein [Phycisphaerae bacterium RAS1]